MNTILEKLSTEQLEIIFLSKNSSNTCIINNYEPKEIIKMIRKWCKLSQKDFAKTLNLSESTIQSYELGRRTYNINTLLNIVETHDINIIL